MRCKGVTAVALAAVALAVIAMERPATHRALAQVLAPVRSDHARRLEDSGGGGARLGSFFTHLSAGLMGVGVDNIRASDADKEGDFVEVADLTFEAESDWRNHGVSLRAGVLDARYARAGNESFTDYHGAVEGTLDILRGTSVKAAAGFAREHEERTSPNEARGSEPTPFERVSADVEAEQLFARLGLRFAASYRELDFDDVDALDGGRINNDDRDRTHIGASLRASYPLSGRLEPFAAVSYEVTDYAAGRDDDGFARDSEAIEGALGAAFKLGGATSAEIALGYRRQSFEDSRLGVVSGMTAEALLATDLTPLTRLRVAASRKLRETTVAGVGGFFDTRVDLGVRHELLRSLEVGLDLAYGRNDFRGAARRDDDYYAAVGASYEVNRYVDAQIQYDFAARDSDGGPDFTRNRVILGFDVHY